MSRPSTKPVSGTRDFLPHEARKRRKIFRIIENLFNLYGFDPLETPSMERLETLLGKYGEEGDQLIFKVLKRGQKLEKAIENQPTEESLADAGLRYDLTVPLARVYAQYPQEFPSIFKRYQIAPVWRADRPQKGRFREFYQCDVDVVGSDSLLAEVEVISVAAHALHELGFEHFSIHLNHRDLLFASIEAAKIDEKVAFSTITILDKLDKIGIEGVKKELNESGLAEESVDLLVESLTSVVVGNENNDTMLQHLTAYIGSNLSGKSGEKGNAALAQLTDLLALLANTPAAEHVAIDPSLARGLSYYTGPIFEIRSTEFSGSIGGGGRYDKLIGMFRGSDVPAVGCSLGIERILMLMEEKNDLSTPAAEVLITVWDENLRVESLKLAQELRARKITTDLYCQQDRYGKQFSYADERKIRYVVIVGPDEIKEGKVKVKIMSSGEQVEVDRAGVVDWLLEELKKS